MIERKTYLEMCQCNSIYPQSIVVECDGIKYYPSKLVVWFDKGKTKNTARMISVIGSCEIECDISKVVCIDKFC